METVHIVNKLLLDEPLGSNADFTFHLPLELLCGIWQNKNRPECYKIIDQFSSVFNTNLSNFFRIFVHNFIQMHQQWSLMSKKWNKHFYPLLNLITA